MKANVRFMRAPEVGNRNDDWETLDYLERVVDPIIPPIGGSYRHRTAKYRVNEIDYGYKWDTSEFEDGEWIAIITVEVS